jgi:hypothetical protein
MADGTTLNSTLVLELLLARGNEGSIFSSSLLGCLKLGNFVSQASTLTLENNRRNETLNLGCLRLELLSLLLGGDFTTNNVLADIILLAQVKELSDLGGALRAKTTGNGRIGETWESLLTSLDDDEGESRQVWSNNASANGLALTFTSTTLTEALVALS